MFVSPNLTLKENHVFKDWVETAHLATPPFDYLSFANVANVDKQLTNVYYLSIMNHFVSKNPTNSDAIAALTRFNKRNSPGAQFNITFNSYWKEKDQERAIEKINKRKLDTLVELNEDTLGDLRELSKKSCLVSSSTSQASTSQASPSTTAAQASSSSTAAQASSSTTATQASTTTAKNQELFEELVQCVHNLSDNLSNFPILDLDDQGVETIIENQLGKPYLISLKNLTNIPGTSLTIYCKKLLSLVVESPPSFIELCSILRKSTLGDVTFDPVVHSDLRFTEMTLRHFLDLITSPRNPLTNKTQERSAATYTTTIIINNLFLSNNDIIDLAWFEREVRVTGTTKWDGVCFAVKDNMLAPVLVELSGGVKANSTPKKEEDDETKMIKKMMHQLNYVQSLDVAPYPIPQFYLRFFNNTLYFEALYLLEYEKNIKRSHFSVVCPTTPNELQEFAEKIPLMLSWKKVVVAWTKLVLKSKKCALGKYI